MSRVVTLTHLARLACLVGILCQLAPACRARLPGSRPRPGATAPSTAAGRGTTGDDAPSSQPAAPGAARQLARRAFLRRRLAAAETHAYRIHLEAGAYLQLVVQQQGTDACLSWSSPDGRRLLEVDSPNGTQGPERLSAVAAAAGDYRLEVRGAVALPGGGYELRVEELRPAIDEDRRRAAATLALSAAERLRSLGTAKAMRAAIPLYEDALRHLRQQGDREQQALALRRLGKAWITLGEVRRANLVFQEALSLTHSLRQLDQEARLLNDLGPTFRLLGEPGRSADCSRRALQLARQAGDRLAEVTAINNLGVLYDSLGETQLALTSFDRALAGWRELKDPVREADTLQNLGGSYTLLGRQDEAIDLLTRALALKRQANDRRGQAAALSAIGWAHYLAGDFQAALSAYAKSLPLRRETGDQRGEAATLDRRATVLSHLGEHDRALASYGAALEILRRVGDRLGEAQVLASMGWLHEAWGRPSIALARFDQALRLFRQVGDQHGEAYALMGSARAARRLGRPLIAQSRIEAALRIVESVHGDVQGRALRTSYLASRQDYYELYVQILMERHRREPGRGWDARALEISNRARARGLFEGLAVANIDIMTNGQPAVVAAARSLEERIRAQEGRRMELLGRPAAGRAVAALDRDIRDLLLEHDRLVGRLGSAGLGQALRSQPPALDVRDIQRLLDEDTLLLWYALGTEGSFLWVVGASSLAAHGLPPRAEIEAAARQFHDLSQESQRKGAREQAQLAAAVLGDMILGPAACRLGQKRLLIAGDGALQYVPFAALPAVYCTEPEGRQAASAPASASRPLLVVEHEIVHIPSAAVLSLVRRELAGRGPAPKTLAVVADPVFRRDDPRVLVRDGDGAAPLPATPTAEVERAAREVGLQGFDRLAYSAAEAAAILALVPPAERWQALGFQASRALVMSGELGRYRIVHFATHGLLDARNPELSGLVLSLVDEHGRPQDGFLRVQDLAHLAIPADLVVLSACRTALGKEIRGEGLVGLTQGFLRCGAGRVLVSLWNVSDLATSELMERFYRCLLKQKLRPAQALREAQLSMLREPRWAAPAYWAGFTLQGEWR
jgi:CHAT domain-containing protein/Tfp pilus assembly protein PilF